MNVYPVVHHLDAATTLAQVELARACGASGVFLISHEGHDDHLVAVASAAKAAMRQMDKALCVGNVASNWPVGINLLSRPALAAFDAAVEAGLDMAWVDKPGCTSAGLTPAGAVLAEKLFKHSHLSFFASVAFKYQALEVDPIEAARVARVAGFIPTTSGPATGIAPDVEKIRAMSGDGAFPLATASGMTPDNVAGHLPYLTHILVSTGIALDEHRIDEAKLRLFIQRCKR